MAPDDAERIVVTSLAVSPSLAWRARRSTSRRCSRRTSSARPSPNSAVLIFGRLMADSRRRRGARLGTAGALIAATAAAHRLPLITRDHDFARLPGVEAVIV
jgi:predicted nucleic acid-binding protein